MLEYLKKERIAAVSALICDTLLLLLRLTCDTVLIRLTCDTVLRAVTKCAMCVWQGGGDGDQEKDSAHAIEAESPSRACMLRSAASAAAPV